MKKIRTRYAPSPTGHLHIGGARTALYSFLYAKKYNGSFIIRFEDTDINRNIENSGESQIENLEWLGIIADESPIKNNSPYGPYKQSDRKDIYNKYIDQLLKSDQAYLAYDTKEEIQKQKGEQKKSGLFSFRYDKEWLKINDEEKNKRHINNEYTIRINLKDNQNYSWNDLVRGTIKINSSDIGDFVIRKQDGFPTYNFACVIDDHLMEISHVFRGEEHISNTPKQIAIYEIMEWEVPQFAHFTIITNMEGKKLSKRDEDITQFVSDFREKGYIPEALLNFLTLLGWSPTHVNEIMTLKEIIKDFDMERMSKSPSKFDLKKLQWFSNKYYKKLNILELQKRLLPYIENQIEGKNKEWIDLLLQSYQPQMFADYQIKSLTQNLFQIPVLDNDDIIILKEENSFKIIKTFYNLIKEADFTLQNIKNNINETKKITGLNGKNLFSPLRLSTTHVSHGPELYKSIFLLGKKDVLLNLERWLK